MKTARTEAYLYDNESAATNAVRAAMSAEQMQAFRQAGYWVLPDYPPLTENAVNAALNLMTNILAEETREAYRPVAWNTLSCQTLDALCRFIVERWYEPPTGPWPGTVTEPAWREDEPGSLREQLAARGIAPQDIAAHNGNPPAGDEPDPEGPASTGFYRLILSARQYHMAKAALAAAGLRLDYDNEFMAGDRTESFVAIGTVRDLILPRLDEELPEGQSVNPDVSVEEMRDLAQWYANSPLWTENREVDADDFRVRFPHLVTTADESQGATARRP